MPSLLSPVPHCSLTERSLSIQHVWCLPRLGFSGTLGTSWVSESLSQGDKAWSCSEIEWKGWRKSKMRARWEELPHRVVVIVVCPASPCVRQIYDPYITYILNPEPRSILSGGYLGTQKTGWPSAPLSSQGPVGGSSSATERAGLEEQWGETLLAVWKMKSPLSHAGWEDSLKMTGSTPETHL